MAFKDPDPTTSKTVILEQVNHFIYLGNMVSHTNELDIDYKLNNFIKL